MQNSKKKKQTIFTAKVDNTCTQMTEKGVCVLKIQTFYLLILMLEKLINDVYLTRKATPKLLIEVPSYGVRMINKQNSHLVVWIDFCQDSHWELSIFNDGDIISNIQIHEIDVRRRTYPQKEFNFTDTNSHNILMRLHTIQGKTKHFIYLIASLFYSKRKSSAFNTTTLTDKQISSNMIEMIFLTHDFCRLALEPIQMCMKN